MRERDTAVLQRVHTFRVFVRTMIAVTIGLLILLACFEYIPLTSGNDLQLLSLFTSQEWLSQRITKDALTMLYVTPTIPTSPSHVQAVNELQNMLPIWEANQQAIKDSNLTVDIQVLFTSTNADYKDIDTAARVIIANPDLKADPIQVQIIRDHERAYFVNAAQIVTILQQKESLRVAWLFGIEVTLGALMCGVELWQLLAIERLVRAIAKAEKEKPI